MHLLSKYPTNPWLGFNEIRKNYGNVVSLKLGQIKAVLVSAPEVMREVLLLKGDIFCDRPSFNRYSLIFGRDKDNCMTLFIWLHTLMRITWNPTALALCDWSDLQKMRRSMAQSGVIPKYGSKSYKQLSNCIESEIHLMVKELKAREAMVLDKQNILILCSNIFLSYLCSKKWVNLKMKNLFYERLL